MTSGTHSKELENLNPSRRISRDSGRGESMNQSIAQITVVVEDYDDAIYFYTNKLGFDLLEDTYIPKQDKRWVLVSPTGGTGTCILLAKAVTPEQATFIGNQSGGRVFLFLSTDDFWRDYNHYLDNGVKFVRSPEEYEYGLVAVFEDLYGNLWDLLEHKPGHRYSRHGV